jgi:hypothetical protein
LVETRISGPKLLQKVEWRIVNSVLVNIEQHVFKIINKVKIKLLHKRV